MQPYSIYLLRMLATSCQQSFFICLILTAPLPVMEPNSIVSRSRTSWTKVVSSAVVHLALGAMAHEDTVDSIVYKLLTADTKCHARWFRIL